MPDGPVPAVPMPTEVLVGVTTSGADLLERARDTLPPRLNAGLLMGDGGFCVLGWMLLTAGLHPITFYGSTTYVSDLAGGGPVVDVVARIYELPRAAVVDLARVNDEAPSSERVARVRAALDALVAAGGPA